LGFGLGFGLGASFGSGLGSLEFEIGSDVFVGILLNSGSMYVSGNRNDELVLCNKVLERNIDVLPLTQ